MTEKFHRAVGEETVRNRDARADWGFQLLEEFQRCAKF